MNHLRSIPKRLTLAVLIGAFLAAVGIALTPSGVALGEPAHAGHTETYFTCGMHPQIVQDEPGTCPICGMDLTERERAPAKSSAATTAAAPDAPDAPASKGTSPKERKILYWVAPMDPSFRSDKPGKSPMGMDLVPVYEDDGSGGSLVEIDPVVVQNMGVRIAMVRRAPVKRSVRTVGEVIPAENRLSVVNLRFSGWIEKIYVDETGIAVKAGDPLFAIFCPELVSAQDELLVALRTGGAASSLARSARRRLELFGLRTWQIDGIVKSGKSRASLPIPSPQDGYVLHKDVVEGAYVKAGMDLYRIADLSSIWVEAEVYEFDAPMVKLGAAVEIALTFQPGELFTGAISYVYPTLNERTRTLRVRIELENPTMRLKPGSFATVSIATAPKEDSIVIPTEAVIHSGTREFVFVALSLGHYSARDVRTGLSGDGYVTEVLEGLREGERVVVSGQFLLDSESQLKEAVQKMLSARLHANSPEAKVKGLKAAETISEASTTGEGKGYWTCGMHPQIVQDDPGTCPICGMDLVHEEK